MCQAHRNRGDSLGEGYPRRGDQGAMTMAVVRSHVADHYARSNLVAAIRDSLANSGKTESTVTAEDLAPVEKFHIGGRVATDDVAQQQKHTTTKHEHEIG